MITNDTVCIPLVCQLMGIVDLAKTNAMVLIPGKKTVLISGNHASFGRNRILNEYRLLFPVFQPDVLHFYSQKLHMTDLM